MQNKCLRTYTLTASSIWRRRNSYHELCILVQRDVAHPYYSQVHYQPDCMLRVAIRRSLIITKLRIPAIYKLE